MTKQQVSTMAKKDQSYRAALNLDQASHAYDAACYSGEETRLQSCLSPQPGPQTQMVVAVAECLLLTIETVVVGRLRRPVIGGEERMKRRGRRDVLSSLLHSLAGNVVHC